MLYLQFDGPPGDPRDQYFGRVLAHAPDPMLMDPFLPVPDPAEPPLPLDPEEIRVIEQGQPNDLAGFNAMQLDAIIRTVGLLPVTAAAGHEFELAGVVGLLRV